MMGFGRMGKSIPYGMFDAEHFGIEAKSARVLERIYHKGHKHAWDGQAVLSSLLEKHGKPELNSHQRAALGRVFANIMWGELAAWKVSAELAAELMPLEAKMAATSQAFDEARHFYVMHDYLVELDAMPDRLDWATETLLLSVMNANTLAKKLLGMQLMIEPLALSLFQVVRKLNLEPVLSELLAYYERDEARHVALGVQYLPVLMKDMSTAERLALWGYQWKMVNLELVCNRQLSRDLMVFGLDPREILEVGMGKQLKALDLLFDEMGIKTRIPSKMLARYTQSVAELSLPGQEGNAMDRCRRALRSVVFGVDFNDGSIDPGIPDEMVPLIETEDTFGGDGAPTQH